MRRLGMSVPGFQAWGSFSHRSSHSVEWRRPARVRSGPVAEPSVPTLWQEAQPTWTNRALPASGVTGNSFGAQAASRRRGRRRLTAAFYQKC
jgi:hypothetical protein